MFFILKAGVEVRDISVSYTHLDVYKRQVRDMWLTGFDVPSMHTMYIDKPMQGHNLMQAIARVNRVFKEKQGGLIVDYIGIAENLKNALNDYTESDREKTCLLYTSLYLRKKKNQKVKWLIYYNLQGKLSNILKG